MFQVVGKIVNNGKIVGLMIYDFSSSKLVKATLKDCVDEIRKGGINNAEIVNGQINITDGSFNKLPIYDVSGTAISGNLPVILERVTSKDNIVGYTLIDKGAYKRLKTADLIRGYSEFYNAKVVTKDGNTFLSAKRGTFRELSLDKQNVVTSKVNNATDDYVCRPGDYEIRVNEDGKKVLVSYNGRNKKIRIPKGIDTIGYYGDEAIIPEDEDSVVESIIIPEGVTTINYGAFIGCTSLTSISIPDSVTFIGKSAFEGCTSLKSIEIPDSVTFIGEGAFANCTSIKSITIPNSVTSINSRVFECCESLINVTIPNSITYIGESAFENCKGLTSITIPDSVTSIGIGAFAGCTGLKSVTIPNSVTEIGNCAFRRCYSIEGIEIPDSVTEIREGTFERCTSLRSITIPDSVTKIGVWAFFDCNFVTVKCSKGSYAEHYAEFWRSKPGHSSEFIVELK